MALPGQQSYAPARPPTERDIVIGLNGSPTFLGVIVSTGAAVNNTNTANPFNAVATTANSLAGTLAGKVLLVQASAAGFLLGAVSGSVPLPLVATQTAVPPLGNTAPGVQLAANTAQIVVMQSAQAALQWISSSGTANLFVWELI